MSGDAIYKLIQYYGATTGLRQKIIGLSPHAMRATAATNALTHEADNRQDSGMAGACEYLNHLPL